jgi:transcriptional regulator with XRE-family HTH domain
MPAATPTQFGQLLRELRQREGLSQSKLAAYLTVDRSTISKLETGSKKPPLDSAFYECLRLVPGFSEADSTLLLKAAQASKSTVVLHVVDLETNPSKYKDHVLLAGRDLYTTARELMSEHEQELPAEAKSSGELLTELTIELMTLLSQLGLAEIARASKPVTEAPFTTSKEETSDIITKFVQRVTRKHGSIWLWEVLDVLKDLESHPPIHYPHAMPDHGSQIVGEGKWQEAPKKGVVYKRPRSHYDSDYLHQNADNVLSILSNALKTNDPALPAESKQALHVAVESVVKSRGASLSQASRKNNIPLKTFSDYVAKELIPVLYRDKNTIYLADDIAEEVSRDYQEAKETGIPPARLLRERRAKYFPEELKSRT